MATTQAEQNEVAELWVTLETGEPEGWQDELCIVDGSSIVETQAALEEFDGRNWHKCGNVTRTASLIYAEHVQVAKGQPRVTVLAVNRGGRRLVVTR